ncbi:uncharacterized protein LOC128983656 [Macrosteles quadrilineatus]|uniref:uncharacterized protein LOC128983656 n=1 Tax=Macrosteles quadrilineatus TaxID=74068 RepID=UPI0023E2F7EF|nr:uncharacterized protein LOC128983656 [Macrosteles quadrilineatus]
MDSRKFIYYFSMIVFSCFYCTGSSWLLAEDFTWSHYIFLLSCLIMLEKYDLVPSALGCPPFYMAYKVVAAIVLANAALFTIWYQVEDLLFWVISEVASLIKHVPGFAKMEVEKDDLIVRSIETLATVYLLLWVIVSSGFVSQMKRIQGNARQGRDTRMNLRSSSLGRQCRSNGRC